MKLPCRGFCFKSAKLDFRKRLRLLLVIVTRIFIWNLIILMLLAGLPLGAAHDCACQSEEAELASAPCCQKPIDCCLETCPDGEPETLYFLHISPSEELNKLPFGAKIPAKGSVYSQVWKTNFVERKRPPPLRPGEHCSRKQSWLI